MHAHITHAYAQDCSNLDSNKEPMDLSTISEKLESGKYKTPWEVSGGGLQLAHIWHQQHTVSYYITDYYSL